MGVRIDRNKPPVDRWQRLLGLGLLSAWGCLADSQILNVASDGSTTPNSIRAPAHPDGLARVSIDNPRQLKLLLGNRNARIVRRDNRDITFRIPRNVPEGCFVPLHLVRAGTLQTGSIPMAISRSGECHLPSYQPSDSWLSKNTAFAARIHSTEWSLENNAAGSSVDVVASFFDGDAATLDTGPLLQFPPPGHCASGHRNYVRGSATIDILLPMLFREVTGRELDSGGALTLDDGRNIIQIPKAVGRSSLFWRTATSSKDSIQPIDTSGNLNLRVPGGSDVDAFVAPLPAPSAFEWLGRPASPIINTSKDLPLRWKSDVAGVVLLSAVVVDPSEAQFSYCLCVAPREMNHFDLPGRVLNGLVRSLGQFQEAAGALYLIHMPEKTSSFSSPRLPTTAGLSLRMVLAKVIFRR